MSGEIKLKSRYGDTHKLVPVEGCGENVYKYVPAEDWMPMYYSYNGTFTEDDEEKELISIDTDGGPYLEVGFPVEGRPIKRIFFKKGVGSLIQF